MRIKDKVYNKVLAKILPRGTSYSIIVHQPTSELENAHVCSVHSFGAQKMNEFYVNMIGISSVMDCQSAFWSTNSALFSILKCLL